MIDIDTLIDTEGLCQTVVEGYSLAWRLLSLKEYRVFRSLVEGGILPPFVIWNMVFERCYIGAYDLLDDQMPAGIPISLGQLIMYWSGDCEVETLKQDIDNARATYHGDSVNEYMKRIILLALPQISLNDIEAWSRVQFIDKFVFAEKLLQTRNPEYQPMDTRKITTNAGQQQQNHGIDFAKENSQLDGALGEREKQARQRPAKLSPKAARQLDRRRPRGR